MANDSKFEDLTIIQENKIPAEQTPPARLICLDDLLEDTLKNLEIALTDGEQTIGRAAQNSICLVYKKISRQHARIYPHNGSWEIEDLQSANGVFVNEQRVTRSRLGHGDIVRLGPVPFRFELERPAPAEQASPPSSAHLGDGGTMYAYHAGVLESLVAAEAASSEEKAETPSPSEAVQRPKERPAGGAKPQYRKRAIRYGLMLLLGVALLGGGYAYLQRQHAQQGEMLAKGLEARFQRFLDHYEGEHSPDPLDLGQRDLTEIRNMAAYINIATEQYPDNASLRALQARVSFIDFEREFARLLGEGKTYAAEQLVKDTQQKVSSLPPGKGNAGKEASEEVTNLLDLAAIIVQFKQFRQRFPDPFNPGPVRPSPYELRAIKALKIPLIEKKKASHLALSITYSRFQQLLTEVEEEDMRFINRWQEVVGQQ
ncbi:MAG: FHA domain-containing protein [Gammaproteobacteria bacterium]